MLKSRNYYFNMAWTHL